MDMPSWNCTPLADLNGRGRTGQAKNTVANLSLWETISTPTEGTEQDVKISRSQAESIGKKLKEQSNRVIAAEEKVASQERMIQQLSSALAKAQEDHKGSPLSCLGGRVGGQRFPLSPQEKTLELAALNLELHQTRHLLECKDSEVDHLLPEVAASRMQESHRLQRKDAEIERLRRELGTSKDELAQLQADLHQAEQGLEHKEAAVNRLLPQVVASRMQSSQLQDKDDEISEIRKELEITRADLSHKNSELQWACQNSEAKDSKLVASGTLMKKLETARSEVGLKDAEINQYRKELESANAELRQKSSELQRAELSMMSSREESEGKDTELRRLRAQISETKLQREGCGNLLHDKDIQIDQVRRELDDTHGELSRKNLELQQMRQQKEIKESELNRIRTEMTTSVSTSHVHKDAEIAKIRRELENAREELTQQGLELQQTHQQKEVKESELRRIRAEMGQMATSAVHSTHNANKDAEIARIRRELENTRADLAEKSLEQKRSSQEKEMKDSELHRMRAEMASSHTSFLQSLEIKDAELDRIRRELANSRMAPAAQPQFDHHNFEQVRLDAERKLSERTMHMQMREQSIAQREVQRLTGGPMPSRCLYGAQEPAGPSILERFGFGRH